MIGYQLQVLNQSMADDRPMLDHVATLLADEFGVRHGWLPGPVVVDAEITQAQGGPPGTRFLVVADP